jgi:DNA-binding transcriptional ArsR family regulator
MGDVFAALADPTRRQVLSLVAEGRARTATELAAALPVTRQAVSKHLAILEGVDAERSGRTMRFHATPEPLSDAIAWMAQVGGEWDARLVRLQAAAAGRGSA